MFLFGLWALLAPDPLRAGAPAFPGAASLEELTARVLKAYEEKDTAALASLLITRDEYQRHVWPELPASQLGSGFEFSFVYSKHTVSQRYALAGRMGQLGGRKLKLVSVSCGPEADKYRGFRILPKVRAMVLNESGQQEEIQPFGSVFLRDGRYKVMSYHSPH